MKKIFKNNRKGVFSEIQLAILALMAIIVFGLILYKSYISLSERMPVQSCKNSIAAHSLIAKGSFSEIFTDIKCPTNDITIKNLNKANEIIAEDMHRCWYIWGEGKGQYFKGDGNFCYICSIYQFSDKGQKITGLYDYLANNDVKVKYAGETPGIKYIDYFQGYTTPNSKRKLDENIQVPVELDTIDTSERYATVFVYASGKDAITKMLEGNRVSTATGLALFGIAGRAGAMGAAGLATAASTAASEELMLTSTIITEFGTISAYGATEAVTGTVLGVTPAGWTIIGVGVLALSAYGVVTLLDVPDPEWAAYVAFRPYNADELKALNCEQMTVNQMSNTGT